MRSFLDRSRSGQAPVVASLSDAGDGSRSGSGLVGAWKHQTASVPTGEADRILLWVRCPIIRNGQEASRCFLQPTIRNGSGTLGGF
ncbi:hypothetical protein DMB66_16670 [Actinoplanes sp. ATCC 53533]|nr:hypothetical protein DMB66_16670 [Actinoplanes sp. ATCC 53533]